MLFTGAASLSNDEIRTWIMLHNMCILECKVVTLKYMGGADWIVPGSENNFKTTALDAVLQGNIFFLQIQKRLELTTRFT